MKIVVLEFKTDAKLIPAEGVTITKGLKNVLVNVVSMGLDQAAPSLRILWRALEEIEDSGEEVKVRIGESEFELIKQAWEAHLPKAGIYYKWLAAVDKIVLQATAEKA